ncbi:MAG: hypothetical protein ACRD98_10575 [Nitrososphaera sp.]
MNIEEILQSKDLLLEDCVLVAKKPPFTWASEARIVAVNDSYEIPDQVTQEGYQYVLECDEILQLFAYLDTKKLSSRTRAEFVIHYAVYDCAPEWITDIPNI